MGDYKSYAINPNTGALGEAMFLYDYFGNYQYGVRFDGDKRVWPVREVESVGPKAADALKAKDREIKALTAELQRLSKDEQARKIERLRETLRLVVLLRETLRLVVLYDTNPHGSLMYSPVEMIYEVKAIARAALEDTE